MALGAGTSFRLGEQNLVENNQDNQNNIQNILFAICIFRKKVDIVYNGVWGESPHKEESFREFLC